MLLNSSLRLRLRSGSLRAAHSLVGDKYQFVHKSAIPSYHFQKSLRRLPIPKLPLSVQRYLASAEVVLSPQQFANVRDLINDFAATDGPELQRELIAYDRQHKDSSYISEPWFDIYLRARVPVAVNYNPFMMYAPDHNKEYMDQLSRATNMVISYGRIKRALDTNVLAPEVFHLNPAKSRNKTFESVCKMLPPSLSWFGAAAFKAFPLDMSQYKSLFNGTRIPRKGKDVLYNDPTQKHFVVLHKGRFFAVRLFDEKDNLLPAADVQASLAWVLKQGALPGGSSSAVGSLTSLDRDSWADARTQLEAEGNGASLKAIDGALFALCLDDLKSTDHRRLVQSLLIGDDAANRWFDKCFQLIVDGNGEATLNFEHSWGDGVAVLRLMEESFKDVNTHHFVGPSDTVGDVQQGHVDEIKFTLSDSMKNVITSAQEKHKLANADVDFATMEFLGLNRNSIKKHGLGPDSVMQLAIQMAYYQLYKEWVPTYESCSTAAFLKGRTECMRSATSATQNATLAILEGRANADEAKKLMKKCSTDHNELVKDASIGNGFDRHLLGLKITADRIGKPVHPFFTSAEHARMAHFILSTSTLSTETLVFGGFGPVVEDGFGIGYNVVDSKLGAVITSNKSKRDSSEFSNALHGSLDQLKGLLESATPSAKK